MVGVLIHGNLWHRGLPTLNAKRRMLILSYTPTWLRKSPHGGAQPEDGLTHAFLEDADMEERMLLGMGRIFIMEVIIRKATPDDAAKLLHSYLTL